MLQFLYSQTKGLTFTPADPDRDQPSSYDCLKASFGVLTVADKYGIPALKAHAEDWFRRLLDIFSNDPPELLAFVPFIYAEFKDQHCHLRYAMVHQFLIYPGRILQEETRVQMMDLMHSIPEFREDMCMGLLRKCSFATEKFDEHDWLFTEDAKWWRPLLDMDKEETMKQ